MDTLKQMAKGFLYHGGSEPHPTRSQMETFGPNAQHKIAGFGGAEAVDALHGEGEDHSTNALQRAFPKDEYSSCDVNPQTCTQQQMRQLRGW